MSSSDDDWMTAPPRPAVGGNSGQSAMMEARRRALQQQREAQQQRQQQEQQQQRPQTSGRRGTQPPPPLTTPSAKTESELPDFLADLDGDDDNNNGEGAEATALHSPSQPTLIFPGGAGTPSFASASPSRSAAAASHAGQTHEATVEELQRQIAAKKKLLQSTKEREAALIEKWRVTKAQKQAEVEQLNGKIRRVWAAIEDEKSASETKIREAQDQHEAELRAARRKVEQEVKAEYDAKIAAAQTRLSCARAEEERLRQLLDDKGGSAAAKDTVNTALTAAITAVMHRLDDFFQSESEEGLRMDAWKAELQTLVQREVQTAFAVGVESEAQAERDEYGRFFTDLLAFWRSAEDQERERLLKMDEALLTDLQTMAQQDLRRLQDEELAMERVYVESREAWAMEHQRLLQRELEAALQRREAELQEQRRQRHSLHVERLRDCEARHADTMAKEEALHQQKMEQLRAYFSREENLRAEQQRVEAAAQESVAQSAAMLRGVMAAAEETAAALQVYERGVDESRRQVEAEREAYLAEQATLLEQLQGLAATQCSSTDAERKSLEDCAAQLRLASQTVDRHLQDEATWLAQQESTYRRSKEEWDREYRRWQQLVQQERQAAEERFHEALTGLQQSVELLDNEEREVAAEQATLQRTFADIEAAAQREVDALQRRVADVQRRSAAIADVQARLTQQKDATAEARRQLTQAQQRLEEETADLREDEDRLRDVVEALRVARSRATIRSYGTQGIEDNSGGGVVKRDDNRSPGTLTRQEGRDGGEARRAAQGHTAGGGSGGAESSRKTAHPVKGESHTAKARHRPRSDPSRLPNKIFRELNDQLYQLSAGAGGEPFVPTMQWTDPTPHPRPARHHSRPPAPQAAAWTAEGQRKRREIPRNVSSREDDLPPPLSASPQSARRERRTRASGSTSPTPQQRQRRSQHQQQQQQQRPSRHVDPSSLPLTSASSPAMSMRGDADWSPSGNTFTNLVDFSDADTTSQSFR